MNPRRLAGTSPRTDERVEALAAAHHDTHLLAQHAGDLAGGVRSDLDGLRPSIDELFRRTDGEQQKLDVLHEHELRLQRIERRQAVDTFTRWIAHQTVPESLLVSVVIASRDRAHCLPDAVASLQAQTYARWEAIIVDDGSTDATQTVLEQLGDDPRVQAVRTDGAGASRARNRGLDEISGDVVIYLDDDNRLDELWLASVVWTFGRRPQSRWLYGARIIDDLQRIETGVSGGFAEIEFEPFDRARLQQGSFIDTGVIAHRRDDALRFAADTFYFGDWDLALQLAATEAPVELPAVAIYYATDQPDRLSGPRNPYFLEGAQAEAELVRRRHASNPDDPAPRGPGDEPDK
jgi:hypothetical protein